ncbi:hypothetical protein B0F90DRAFT_1022699 [Multifurca ochricompacta]|uniref:Uncharacterized protein n=1 Tax=Multifurca ochricompacta TaxID=376703 RepID=A0AAD4QLF1_9AGAM|nr:hypothetical protein B0F90DRAFT_1022699 [Multifurca ochricompacta]
MYDADTYPDEDPNTDTDRNTDINLANEADKNKTFPDDKQQQEQEQQKKKQQRGEVDKTNERGDGRRWEIWLLGTLNDSSPVVPLPSYSYSSLDKVHAGAKTGTVDGAVLLQRGLRASNFEFVKGELRVLQDPPSVDSSSGAREGWAIEVRRWRWARS